MRWGELVYICCRAGEGKIMDFAIGDWRWTALGHRAAAAGYGVGRGNFCGVTWYLVCWRCYLKISSRAGSSS